MDLSYATIPVFGGDDKILYRESQLSFIISDEKNLTNHPVYSVDTRMGSCILQIDDSLPDSLSLKKPTVQPIDIDEGSGVWTMFFNGACTKESARAGIVFISPSKENT